MSAPEMGQTDFRVDLHIHTRHSRLRSLAVLKARDCYSRPSEVYRRALERGMDLVTFTDHDTIEGCLELLDREGPLEDFFISEEVSTRDPRSGCGFHVSVFGIDEGQHAEIQRLRGDVLDLAAYLSKESIPASLNHVGSSLVRRSRSLDELVEVLAAFPLIETRNGAQLPASNAVAELLAQKLANDGLPVGRTGGSDAHTTHRIGWTWTKAQATDRESFLAALSAGCVEPEGLSASLAPMLRDVYHIVAKYYGDLVRNGHGHFAPGERRLPAACALLTLPLHLVALPATGTLYRQIRVLGASRELARDLVHSSREDPLAVSTEAEIA
jgi:predicted metal-dependent phosphoesterase TrpH